MILESVRIQNFRCVQDETLHCSKLTALLGSNGAGKSTFLRALDSFYSPSARADTDDFFNRDTKQPFSIALTFNNLNKEAQSLFQKYIDVPSGTLTVERVFYFEGDKVVPKYHGSTLQNPDFQSVKEAFEIKDRLATAKIAFNALKSNPEYSAFPKPF